MTESSDGVFKKIMQGCREILTGSVLFLVPASAWLVWHSLVTPSAPWVWVAYVGWGLGFLGIWIGWARWGKPLRDFASDALAAIAAVGVTLLGVFSPIDVDLAGALLSGLGVVGLGVWVLRRVVNSGRDEERQERHTELVEHLRRVEERLAQPATPVQREGLIRRFLRGDSAPRSG